MSPKRLTMLSVVVVLLVAAVSAARTPTDYSALKGTWVNSTSGLFSKIVIGTDSTGRLFLHAYGACSPTPCDWGTVYPSAWSGSPFSASAAALIATYGSSYSSSMRIITVNLVYVTGQPTRLRVNCFTQFNLRGDPRYNYWATEMMSK